MSLCKSPTHLHVKPTDQNMGNRMFSIKVSHIKKRMKVRDKEMEGGRASEGGGCHVKCDRVGSFVSGVDALKEKAAS